LDLARVKRSDVEDLLEEAKRPIGVEIKYNGNPKPATTFFLRSYEPSKPMTQAEAAKALNCTWCIGRRFTNTTND